jgi:hypothetical protein
MVRLSQWQQPRDRVNEFRRRRSRAYVQSSYAHWLVIDYLGAQEHHGILASGQFGLSTEISQIFLPNSPERIVLIGRPAHTCHASLLFCFRSPSNLSFYQDLRFNHTFCHVSSTSHPSILQFFHFQM